MVLGRPVPPTTDGTPANRRSEVSCYQAALISDLTAALDAAKERGLTTFRHVSLIPGGNASVATLPLCVLCNNYRLSRKAAVVITVTAFDGSSRAVDSETFIALPQRTPPSAALRPRWME